MKHRPEDMPARQIMLALDSAAGSLALMESAILLAERLQGELQGLFVEDTDLLRVADLPFTREVIVSSASERPVRSVDMSRSLRALASRLREDLAYAAERAQIRWSFRTVRGPRLRAIMEEGASCDVLIVGRVLRGLWQTPPRNFARPRSYPTCFVYSESVTGEKALSTAVHLSQATGSALLALLPGADPDRRAALRAQLQRRLQTLGTVARVDSFEDQDDLAARLGQGAAVVVLPDDLGLIRDAALFQRLLDRLSCPVVIVR